MRGGGFLFSLFFPCLTGHWCRCFFCPTTVEIGEEKKNKEGNTIIGGVNKFDSYNRRTKKKIEVYNEISISKRHVSNDIVILHEMIHALGGLEHTDSGLMQEFLTADQDKTIYDSTIKEIIEKGKGRNK